MVRAVIHRLGFRFRMDSGRRLPGKPDIVLVRHRIVIFVHGCFWHRHSTCSLAYVPKSRVEFWTKKFNTNVERDRRVERELRNLGWRVLKVWECETRKPERLERRLSLLLGRKPNFFGEKHA